MATSDDNCLNMTVKAGFLLTIFSGRGGKVYCYCYATFSIVLDQKFTAGKSLLGGGGMGLQGWVSQALWPIFQSTSFTPVEGTSAVCGANPSLTDVLGELLKCYHNIS